MTTEDEFSSLLPSGREEEEPPGAKDRVLLAETIRKPVKINGKHTNPSISDFPLSIRSREFLSRYFPQATEKEWNSWQWQLKNSFTSLEGLQKIMQLNEDELRPHREKKDSMPVRITPYYASLLDPEDPAQALRRTMVPVFDEYLISKGESSDPLGEEEDSPAPNIVHRYPDRVLFLVTGFCAAYCRYCTRSHMVAQNKCHGGFAAWEAGLQYIQDHTEIRDVLISGGDPLSMPDGRLQYLLSRLRSIQHVEIIRIGSKMPVVLPQRITNALVNMLKKYHPLYLSLHFTHPDEITTEVAEACRRLADAGIPLGSQTVLLKGINDNVETMKRLMQSLLKIRVRPYYLYQCDPIPGSAHFRTPVEKGLEIIRGLRGHTTGYAVPQFVIDAPGGGGKIPLLPNYVESRNDGELLLRNYKGNLYSYPDHV